MGRLLVGSGRLSEFRVSASGNPPDRSANLGTCMLAAGARRTTDYNLTNQAWPHQGNSKYSTGATTDQRVGPGKEGQVCGVVTNKLQ
jgi:hypothetical protein